MDFIDRAKILEEWQELNAQFEEANDKLKGLSREILKFVKEKYNILLNDFARDNKVYLSRVNIFNGELTITYTDRWYDDPEFGEIDIPISDICDYEKYFEERYMEELKKLEEQRKRKEDYLEILERNEYLRLKKKYEGNE